MRKAFWARLLILVVLLSVLPLGGTALAAGEAQPPKVHNLNFAQIATAGSTVTFNVYAQADANLGICCGTLTLKGPGDQTLNVHLSRVGATQLSGSLTLSPNMPTGAWIVSSLSVTQNDGQVTRLTDEEKSFKHFLSVLSAGKPADTKVPELVSITVPDTVQMGDPVVIKAVVKDDLSGVASVHAFVESTADNSLWTLAVELFPTGKTDEYAGTMIMDLLTMLAPSQHVVRLVARDKAGNRIDLEREDLAKIKANKLVTKGEVRKVPEGLLTSPYINLIHGGELSYWRWMEIDAKYLEGLLQELKSNPVSVREKIAAELPQLRLAIDALRKEVYVDPATKLKVSSATTSGKWLAFDRAVLVRIELLTEIDRRAGRTRSGRSELTAAGIKSLYTPVDEGEVLMAVEGAMAEAYALLPTAYLSILSKAPEAVKVLLTPAHESVEYGPLDQFDRDTLYFLPVVSSDSVDGVWGTNSFLFRHSTKQLTEQLQDLFYELGFHFGEAYFSALTDPAAQSAWGPYLAARGNQSWTSDEGYIGTPINNIGDDFAWTFLPYDLGQQYYSVQSYGRLRDNKAQAEAFKKLVTTALAKAPAAFTVSPESFFSIGVGPFLATLTSGGRSYVLEAEGLRWRNPGAMRKPISGTTAGNLMTYSSTETEVGGITWFYLDAKAADGRAYQRYLYYFQAPVILDPFPAATNQPTVKLTGTAPAGAAVTVAGKSATADAKGRFTLTVPLTEGQNKLKLTVAGSPLAAAFTVKYEKAKTVSVKVTLPGATVNPVVSGTVETEPYAIVNYGTGRTQADAAGKAAIAKQLKEGANKVEVTVTNAAGNQGTWSGVIMVDSTPPTLTVTVPAQTNMAVYKVEGSTEPGATLVMGESILPVATDGSFTAEVALTAGQTRKLEFTATDAAGNRRTVTADIKYVRNVPAVVLSSTVILSGTVEPGTNLTYQGSKVSVTANGAFSKEVAVQPGSNVYDLVATTKDGKPAGFLRFTVVYPLKVTAIAKEGDKVRVGGKTVPGYIVLVDGESVTVDTNGDWSALVAPKGRRTVTVIAEGGGQVYEELVLLP